MKQADKSMLPHYVLLLVVLLLVLASLLAISRFWSHANPSRTETVEQAIRKATVQCYALEGGYAPDVAYLVQHYGLQVDLDQYAVRYEVFASNIMPEIEVQER